MKAKGANKQTGKRLCANGCRREVSDFNPFSHLCWVCGPEQEKQLTNEAIERAGKRLKELEAKNV